MAGIVVGCYLQAARHFILDVGFVFVFSQWFSLFKNEQFPEDTLCILVENQK